MPWKTTTTSSTSTPSSRCRTTLWRSSRPEAHDMRLIGLEPGLRLTGWGVIEVGGNRLRRVAHGVVRVPTVGTLADRLRALFEGVAAIVEAQRPIEAAVEETFVTVNPVSTLKLGQARGVV